MSKLRKIPLLLVVTSALAVTSSFGQIFFDENGNSAGPGGPLPFSVAPDPINGILTLVYTLPFAVTSGDVLVSELATSQTNSDLLRFHGNQVWVFSELDPTEPHPDLADVPVIPPPATSLPIAGPFAETGPEGNNGIAYTPVAGGPGFPGTQITYQFASDVPEPVSLTLLGFGALAVLMRRRYVGRN